MKTTLVLAAALCCGSVYAGLYSDDFNRANTAATTDGSVIGANWNIVGNEFSIYQQNLQFKGATINDNHIYNTNAVTDDGDFTLKVDLIHNNAANNFNYNIGAVWGIGSKDGTGNDGWAVRFGDDIWQVLRIHDGGLASLGTGTMNKMLQGVAYTLTISSSANQVWDFSVDRASDNVNFGSFSASDLSGLTSTWTGGYGGVFYNNNVSQSRADNFSVESPSSIPEPATLVLIGIAGLGLAATRRLRMS